MVNQIICKLVKHSFVSGFDKSNCVPVVKDPILPLLRGNGNYMHNDSWLVLNSERLIRDKLLDSSDFNSFVEERFKSQGASFEDSGLTDTDIINNIKSRYIQSVPEVLQYIDNIAVSYGALKRQSQEVVEPPQPVEPVSKSE